MSESLKQSPSHSRAGKRRGEFTSAAKGRHGFEESGNVIFSVFLSTSACNFIREGEPLFLELSKEKNPNNSWHSPRSALPLCALQKIREMEIIDKKRSEEVKEIMTKDFPSGNKSGLFN